VNPHDNEDLYRSIVVGGKTSPGIVTLSGHDNRHNWDTKTMKEQDGAESTYLGSPVCQFEARFKLVVDYHTGVDQFALWDEFQRVLEKLNSGNKPLAVSIYHPDLARLRITEVQLASIGGMTHDDKGDGYVSVKFLEHRHPKKKAATTAKVVPNATFKPVDNGPNAAREKELRDLRLEYTRR
jgi:hypothetical protein